MAGDVSEAIQVLGEKLLSPLADDGLLHINGLSHVGLEDPASSKKIIFRRPTSPAVIVVDRCHRPKVWRSSGERAMHNDDLRPRAIAISFQQYGCGWPSDTGMRPQGQANLDSFS
jgi:hypothetical protein